MCRSIQIVTDLDERLSVVQVRLQQVDERQADVDGGRLAEAAQEGHQLWLFFPSPNKDYIDMTC